jgi:hypothetical protein
MLKRFRPLDRTVDAAFLPDAFFFADFFADLLAMVLCLPQETRLLHRDRRRVHGNVFKT